MNVKISKSPDEFLNDYEIYLAKDCKTEAINQLILYNAGVYKEEKTEDNIMGAVIDNNKVILIFLNAKPFCLLCYQMIDNEEATKVLANYIVKNNIDINGINTTKKINEPFRKYYSELTGLNFKKRIAMDIMYLDKLNEINKAIGKTEVVNYQSMDLMAFLFSEFANECFSEEHKTSDFYESVKKKIFSKCLYSFYNADNILVSICATGRTLRRGTAISAVYTLPMFRNCGYSTTLVHNICEEILKSKQEYCTLYVDQNNPFSNKVYKRVGFTILCDSEEYIIEK